MALRFLIASTLSFALLLFAGTNKAAAQAGSDPFGNSPFGDQQADPFGGPPKPVQKPAGSAQLAPAKRPAQAAQPTKAAAKQIRKSTQADDRNRAAFNDETTQAFIQTPLEEAIQAIARTHDIPIVIDRRALEEIGLTPDTPVNINLKKVSLRSFMRLMLRELQLTYMFANDIVIITTPEAAEKNSFVRMYTVPPSLSHVSDKIIKAMQTTVQADAWETAGGPATAAAVEHVIVVSGTESLHDNVDDFMDKLKVAYEKRFQKMQPN